MNFINYLYILYYIIKKYKYELFVRDDIIIDKLLSKCGAIFLSYLFHFGESARKWRVDCAILAPNCQLGLPVLGEGYLGDNISYI